MIDSSDPEIEAKAEQIDGDDGWRPTPPVTKADDLVERLRKYPAIAWCDEAADALVSLRAQLAAAEAERDDAKRSAWAMAGGKLNWREYVRDPTIYPQDM